MKKLTKWFKALDDNLIHIAFTVFIFAVSLVPKFPLAHVEYTYIKIRIDDLLPVALYLVFFVQWIRRKIILNTKFMVPIVLFWVAVFTSFLYAFFVLSTIPDDVFNIGLLHSLRRIEYMGVFFVASSVVASEKRFYSYLKYYLITLTLVCLYGIGQKFLQFPSIQSMNPAYVDGRLLSLNPEDRINSTFGGHFDLAGYLTLSMPLIVGYYFYKGFKRYTLLFVLALLNLLYTAARSSFVAYVVSMFTYLTYVKKFKYLLFVMVSTAVLLVFTGDMTKRILQTFQFKIVYMNTKTNSTKIEQKITVKNLPAGGYTIPGISGKTGTTVNVADKQRVLLAREEVLEKAKRQGVKLTEYEIDKQAQEIAPFIQARRMLLCDISCSTRLEKEWPRAILAFRKSPLLGTGPSSITEATDNDYLRSLGEVGLVGSILFAFILGSLIRVVLNLSKRAAANEKFIFRGFIFGIGALLINALYVDVFEASKVAYNFWLLAGLFVGLYTLRHGKTSKNKAK